MKHIIIIAIFALFTNLLAAIGTIKSISGDATIERKSKIIAATLGAEIEKNDVIKTIDKGRVKLVFSDNTVIHLSKNAHFSVSDYLFDDTKANSKMEFQVLNGMFKSVTGRIGKLAPSKFKLKTKTATIGIRGTTIIGKVAPTGDKIGCSKGAIAVSNKFGTVEFKAGQFTSVTPGQAPKTPKAFDASFAEVTQESGAMSGDGEGGDAEGGDAEGGDDEAAEDDEAAAEDDEAAAEDDGAAEDEGGDDQAAEDDGATTEDESGDAEGGDAPANDDAEGGDAPANDDAAGTPDGGTDGTDGTDGTGAAAPDGTTPDAPEADVPTDLVDDVVSDVGDTAADTLNTSVSADLTAEVETVVATEAYVPTHYTTTQQFVGGGMYTIWATSSNDFLQVSGVTFDALETDFTSTSSYLTGTLTNSSYDTAVAYDPTSFTSSVGTLPYSFTDTASNEYTGTYDVYMDNRGEFMYGLAADSYIVSTTDSSVTATSYYDLFYAGKASTAALDPTKLYVYKDTAWIDASYLSDPASMYEASIGGSGSEIVINGKLGILAPRYTVPSEDFYGATEYLSVTINSDGSITSGESIYLDAHDHSLYITDAFDGQLYGDEFQGLGVTTTSSTYLSSSSYDLTTPDSYEAAAGVAVLKSVENLNAQTGTVQMTGYFNWAVYDPVPTTPTLDHLFTTDSLFELNRDTGAISISTVEAGATQYAYFEGSIAATSATSANSSYYVSDDNFGVLSTSVSTDGSNSAVGGFLVSRPDSYDATTNTLSEKDDYSSWGYWTTGFDDGKVILVNSTWVAGVETAVSDVAALVTANATATFNGHVLGSVMDTTNGFEPILMNGANSVALTLNFSDAVRTVTGSISFASASSSWNETLSGSIASTNDSFGFSSANLQGGGSFFGPGVQSVGGTFGGSNAAGQIANGVFKASR